jgi:hypothetical protein
MAAGCTGYSGNLVERNGLRSFSVAAWSTAKVAGSTTTP